MGINQFIEEGTNFGMNLEISIGVLVEKIIKLMGKMIKITCDEKKVRSDTSEVEQLFKNTKWHADYNLEKGPLRAIDLLKNSSYLYKSELYYV